jgi:hypothetical protein
MRSGEVARETRKPLSVKRVLGLRPQAVSLSFDDLRITLAPGTIGPPAGRAGCLALSLSPGRWAPPANVPRNSTLSVVSGALLRTRGDVPDLLLPGDMSEVRSTDGDRWKVLSSSAAALVVLLTPATVAELAAVPGATQALLRARSRQHERDIELRSIVGIYDIEDRILSFFAHLARHIGEPEGAATRIPLRLEQRRVEEILSAGHTQATTAFRSLFQAGTLVHDATGWLFRGALSNAAEQETCSAPNTFRSNDH